ncbi:hypothetical protein [Tolypothrix sp. PCC 7910]|uniref:hypothetical protein n=1 Tax=Tolypothrix sp. PCC 7910 TaxID=2099387 RepID=UPI001FCB95DD|nr:hypothetical protein [Tolypothrix sp. PCC 7910]
MLIHLNVGCVVAQRNAPTHHQQFWGNRFLPSMKKDGKSKKSPGQMSLPWDKQRVTEDTEVHEVAEKFILANCYNPAVPGIGNPKC